MLMVVTVAFAGFRIGLNAWERGGRAIDRLEKRATIERLMRRQLAVAVPMKFKIGDNEAFLFRGSSSRLEFISDYSLVDGSVDFRKVDYAIAGSEFRYSDVPLGSYKVQPKDPEPSASLADVQKVSFEYLGPDEHDVLHWSNDWIFGRGMPLAVRIHFDSDTMIVRLVNR